MDVEYSPSYWTVFKGNNHNNFVPPSTTLGGPVDFTEYVGEFLCKRLWVDLVYRFKMTGLRIYEHDEPEWTDGGHPGNVKIYLSKDGTIQKILFYPR